MLRNFVSSMSCKLVIEVALLVSACCFLCLSSECVIVLRLLLLREGGKELIFNGLFVSYYFADSHVLSVLDTSLGYFLYSG